MEWGLVQKPTGFPIVVLCFFFCLFVFFTLCLNDTWSKLSPFPFRLHDPLVTLLRALQNQHLLARHFVAFIGLLLAWFKAVGSSSEPREIIMVMSPGMFFSLALVHDGLRLYCVQIPVVFFSLGSS